MGNLANSRARTVASENDDNKISTINAAQQILDSMEAGKLDVSITTADVTLTGTPAAPQAQNKYFDLSGTLTGNRSLIFPVNDDDPPVGNPREIIVKNGTSGAFSVTVKVSGQTGVTVSQGYYAKLLHTGTDWVKLYEVNYTTGLISLGTLPAVPYARAYHNADQSISNDTSTAVALNSEREDTDTIHDNSTNNSRLTCKTAGLYHITGNLLYAFHATGYRDAVIRLDGTTTLAQQRLPAVSSNSEDTAVMVSTVYRLAVNQYVELIAKQTSGGSLNVRTGANFSPEFMMTRLGS